MAPSQHYRPIRHDILTTQGINQELWIWLRSHAAIERRNVGAIINELIERYKNEVASGGVAPQLTSTYELEPKHQHSIRGIDRNLWQWLKSRSIVEYRFLGEILNALIERHRREVGAT